METLDDFNFADGSTRNCAQIFSGSPESAPMFSVVFFWIVPMAAVDIISRVLALTPDIASDTL